MTNKQTDAAENIQRSSLYATTLVKNCGRLKYCDDRFRQANVTQSRQFADRNINYCL